MIIPGNRLLIWVAVVLPFSVMGALVPAYTGLSIVLFVALFILVLFDAFAAGIAKRGFTVSVPDIIRLSKDRAGSIQVRIRNEGRKATTILIGLPLPACLQSDMEVLDVLIPANSVDTTIPWPCTPTQRGNFPLDACYFEIASPLGFWKVRGRSPSQSVIRVYPNLLGERKRLAALFLNRGNSGSHVHRTVGQGREFEKLREYQPGDSYDEIHWKATAKRGRPVTKLFQVERTQEIYVIIDSSRLSARTADAEPAMELFLKSALTLGLVAEQQSDLFGLIVFGGKIRRFIRASGGKAHYHACRDAIYALDTELVAPDFEELSAFIRLRLRRRALLLVLTDLSDPVLAESFLKNIEMVRGQHLIMVSMIKPAVTAPLFSQPDADSIDSIYQKLGGHMAWRNLGELEKSLRHRGIGFSMLDGSKLSSELVSQYMNVKARQML